MDSVRKIYLEARNAIKEFKIKTVGIVGGIAPESTIEYYRQIIASYRKHSSVGNYPSIIINSINLRRMLDLIAANELAAVTDYLLDAIEKLARAGADFAVLASNHRTLRERRECCNR